MLMPQSSFNDVAANGTGLCLGFRCFRAGGMFCFVLFVTADRTFMPVIISVLAPRGLIAVVAVFFLLANAADTLMGISIHLGPLAPGMGSCYRNSFHFGCITVGAGIGLFALFLAGCFLCYRAAVPAMRSGFFLRADGTGVLVCIFVDLLPCSVAVIRCFVDFFGFTILTSGTSDGLLTFLFAGSRLCYLAVIPAVRFCNFLLTHRAGILMICGIHCSQITKDVVIGFGNGFRFGCAADCASVGHDTLFLAACSFINGAIIPFVSFPQ